ncbi:MAG: CYTH domain-containing protein [Bacilli bacterium]|nr:CYTH domain-containing protein [Bacilli bacterium]
MQKGKEFRSLLTKDEYNRLIHQFQGNKTDLQTNHYFDTPRFSLKAQDISLRVKERDDRFEIALKHKKGYSVNEISIPITQSELIELQTTGLLKLEDLQAELSHIIKDQKLINFLSLSTNRLFLNYYSGILFIDESTYQFPTIMNDNKIVQLMDHEMEYEAKDYELGKKEFIQLISDFDIQYKKSDKKIKRAFNTYKRLH